MEVVKNFFSDPATMNGLLTLVTYFTAHSLKATILSELAHAHAHKHVFMSLGHWKTLQVAAKHTRNRQAISVKGMKEVIASLRAKWEGEGVNSGIGFSEGEKDETVAESLVFDQACAKSGGEHRKLHNKHFRQCGAEKFGLSDAAPAQQASQNNNARSEARSKMNPYPIEASLTPRLHWIRNTFPARQRFIWDGQLGSTNLQQASQDANTLEGGDDLLADFAFTASKQQSTSEIESPARKSKTQARLESQVQNE